jgi:signal-transduction protein with cAMP-binding, CBS, and nucleotidyltransferase domain
MDVLWILDQTEHKPAFVRSDATVGDAARALSAQDAAAVLVLDPAGRLAGIISEDAIAAGICAHGASLCVAPARTLMREPTATCGPHESLFAVLRRMTQHGLREMAVVEDRRPIAVITQRQVLASWLGALAIEQSMRRPYGATSNADLVDLALADD